MISRVIRFGERQYDRKRERSTKLAVIRNIWKILREYFPNPYNPGGNVTLDKHLVAVSGLCPFIIFLVHYIPLRC